MPGLDAGEFTANHRSPNIPPPPIIQPPQRSMSNVQWFLNRRSMELYWSKYKSAAFSGPDFVQLNPVQAGSLKTAWKNAPFALRKLKDKHKGLRVHVFGTGPSLERTKTLVCPIEDIVIGVNGAFEAGPLNYWVVLDDLERSGPPGKWKSHFETYTFSTTVFSKSTWLDFNWKAPDVVLVENGAFDFDRPALSWNGSSVHAALHLALWMGAREVILHGVDYRDRTHFYQEEKPNIGAWTDFAKHVAGFTKLQAYAAERGVQVWNANKESMLPVFPTFPGPIPTATPPAPNNVFVAPTLSAQDCVPAPLPDGSKIDVTNMAAPVPEEPPKPRLEAVFDLLNNTVGIDNGSETVVYTFDELKQSEHKHILNCLKGLRGLAAKVGEPKIPAEE
jgi:hypothetical protein